MDSLNGDELTAARRASPQTAARFVPAVSYLAVALFLNRPALGVFEPSVLYLSRHAKRLGSYAMAGQRIT